MRRIPFTSIIEEYSEFAKLIKGFLPKNCSQKLRIKKKTSLLKKNTYKVKCIDNKFKYFLYQFFYNPFF